MAVAELIRQYSHDPAISRLQLLEEGASVAESSGDKSLTYRGSRSKSFSELSREAETTTTSSYSYSSDVISRATRSASEHAFSMLRSVIEDEEEDDAEALEREAKVLKKELRQVRTI